MSEPKDMSNEELIRQLEIQSDYSAQCCRMEESAIVAEAARRLSELGNVKVEFMGEPLYMTKRQEKALLGLAEASGMKIYPIKGGER